jgi:nonribosomal peptide synthetase DhbF
MLGDPADPDSVAARQLTFWRTALADLPEEIILPTDRPRSAALTYRGDSIALEIPVGLHRSLSDLAQQEGASVFMVVQAVIALLLSRLGAGQDIPLGAPVAGRTDDATTDLVGFFANTLVLRTDLSGDPPFTELLRRVKETALDAYAHQDLPFESIVEDLAPQRTLARNPLFQVMLTMRNSRPGELSLAGVDVATELVETGMSPFDLLVELDIHTSDTGEPAGLIGDLKYSTDLFDRRTVVDLADRLVSLMTQLVLKPETRVSEFDLWLPGERRRVLEEWNDTRREVPGLSLPQVFETQVERHPDRTAIIAPDGRLTFRELNARANRLARLLVEHGAGPETVVGIAVPRSTALAVAIWALIKAGAAYLPLDPDYPAERVAFLLKDVGPVAVIGTMESTADLAYGGRLILLDDPSTGAALA